jgi:hypothetical protein
MGLPSGTPGARQPQVEMASVIAARLEARETRPDSMSTHALPSQLDVPSYHENSSLNPIREKERAAPAVAKIPPEKNATSARAIEPSPRLPQPADFTWYGAHEIDAYPRALVPLRLDLPAPDGLASAGARLLLWLRIDEHGAVVEVKAGEGDLPAHWLDAARARLAAVRFVPARKDERAVKSRLQVSIALDPANAGGDR